jgi:hypothetical protein
MFQGVIQGRIEDANPESRDSGFALCAPRNDGMDPTQLRFDALRLNLIRIKD